MRFYGHKTFNEIFTSYNVIVTDECRMFFNLWFPSEKIEKYESVVKIRF